MAPSATSEPADDAPGAADPPSGGWAGAVAPDLATIERLAEAALDAMPPRFAAACTDLMLRVEDLADAGTLASIGAAEDEAYTLTGLYEGPALTERAHDDLPEPPARVTLYRLAILAEWAERGDVPLDALVAHVLVHEVAHHLGWSDADIAAIDAWWT